MKSIFRVLLTLALIAGSAHASVIAVVPTGLNPGDQYRLAFVTSAIRDGTSPNIADYNAFVTGVANSVTELAALGTTWTAIASAGIDTARDNTNTNPSSTGVPIYLLNDTKLADNNADLWDGTIDNALGVTETGAIGCSLITVWTGSAANGQGSPASSLGGHPVGGRCDSTGSTWMYASLPGAANSYHLYAMSGLLTVAAVPVPGAVWLFGSALGVMGWLRRKATA